MSQVPPGAIAIEISPHALLQAPLKRGLQPGAMPIGLMSSKAENGGMYLLEQLCRLHATGVKINVDQINDQVQWPVSELQEVQPKKSLTNTQGTARHANDCIAARLGAHGRVAGGATKHKSLVLLRNRAVRIWLTGKIPL